ncbi:MAG: substrate-binding domain-containing protein [Bdellovibrionota bacterium]
MSLFPKLFVSIVLVVGLFSAPAQSADLSGMVTLDGSSTVYPISAAIAEEFQRKKQFSKVRVTVAYSGTGGGFKKWCKGETDINDASRPIKDKEESCAKENGISYVELPVAYDALSVVVSSKNKFLNSLTMAQLKQIFESGSKVKTWKDLDPKFPAEEVKLYSPGHDSGTFDYFTEAVMHESRKIRLRTWLPAKTTTLW